MADIDGLVVRIKADATQLDRELKRLQGVTQQGATRMQNSIGGLSAAFRGLVPAVSAAAFVAWGKSAIAAAGNMVDLSQQIGFAASTLSALEGRLAASGATLDQFASSINLMNANIGQAVSGNEQMAEAFTRLGLSVDQLKRLSPEEQFYLIADALSRVGTQYEQTELARAIFGRGVAALLPLIKESNGDLRETVKAIENTGDALSGETLARIDAFGDAMTAAAKKARNEFLDLFATVLKVSDFLASSFGEGSSPGEPGQPRNFTGAKIGLLPRQIEQANRGAYLKKAAEGGFMTRPGVNTGEQFGPAGIPASEINRRFSEYRKGLTVTTAGSHQAAKATEELSDATQAFLTRAERAKEIFEQTRTPLERHNESVAEAKALYEEGLITLDTYTRVQNELAEAMDDTGQAAVVNARLVKDSFADALESAMFDFENFGNSAKGILEGIARNIARERLINPLSDSLFGNKSTGQSGLLDGIFGFADGGNPPVGRPSIVGERGPEIFVPKTAGTIIPNHAMGGNTVVMQQTFNINAGVQGTVRKEIMEAVPFIVAQSKAAVMQGVERRGAEARVLGKRG